MIINKKFMKFIVFSIIALASISIPLQAQASSNYGNVKGYYRKDGTYVRPYVRTYPDVGVKYNNLSWLGKGINKYDNSNTNYYDYYNNYTERKLYRPKIIKAKPQRYITFGTSKDDVIRMFGQPSYQYNYNGSNYISYGSSTISFDDYNKVKNWSNYGDLNVWAGDQDPNATVQIGDSKDQVIKVFGTPDSIQTVGNITAYYYSDSSVIVYIDNNNIVTDIMDSQSFSDLQQFFKSYPGISVSQ